MVKLAPVVLGIERKLLTRHGERVVAITGESILVYYDGELDHVNTEWDPARAKQKQKNLNDKYKTDLYYCEVTR